MNTEIRNLEVKYQEIKPTMTEERKKELLDKLEYKIEFYKAEDMTWYNALEIAHQDLEAEIGEVEYSEFNNFIDEGSIQCSVGF